jgi:hypothetical protein
LRARGAPAPEPVVAADGARFTRGVGLEGGEVQLIEWHPLHGEAWNSHSELVLDRIPSWTFSLPAETLS